MFKRIWITRNGKQSNRKRKRRKIQSTTPAPAPAPGSGSGSGGENYDVFLSFRGEDTRKGFADYLFTDLIAAGVHTFRDNNNLTVGEEIAAELPNAIQESKICIPIFSKNYASSKWCLRELADMVTWEKKIIPIFYDVEPSDVRHQRGSYQEAFRQHDKNFDKKTVQEWKEALKRVADLKGFELKKQADGYEGELAKKVVEKVLTGLKKNHVRVPETLIGIDDHVAKMKGLLNVESNGVRIVGIHGMGGLGKTTIAKSIYNQLCETKSFECCCFLQDIRETEQQKDSVCLQNQLLSTIRKGKGRVIDNVDNGIEEIKNAVKGKKVLIVLDDDDEKCQFSKFADNCDFGSGSRIIVTTRNEEVLNRLRVTCDKLGQLEVYRPEFMNRDHSLQLFSKHAFDFESPSSPKDYETLSFLGVDYETLPKKVVSYAKGLPLVLVVIGSLLRGVKDKIIWEATLQKLEETPADDVQKKLRISYDSLDDGQKQIFCDIACLFVGEGKTNLLYMWEDCGFQPKTGINVLVHRSLIKVGDDDRIWMHDQVRDLGRLIVDEENFTNKGERSRLWRWEEASSVLESHTGTKKVVALSLDSWKYRCLEGKDFNKLRNLRFLRLWCSDLDGDFERRLLNLRWLQYSHGNFKPTNLGLKNLVVLKLSGGDITWSEIKMATKLKVLHLSCCSAFKRVSDFYSFKSLEKLSLDCCESLLKFDPSDGNLTKLRVLHLSDCNSLRRVNCSTFSTLESLDLCRCESLRSLEGLEQLKSLTHMHISDCENLIEIQGLDRLESLESLDLSECFSIEELPDLSSLKKLTTITAHDCVELTEIEGLGELKSLKSLNLCGCESIEKLPDLSSLKNLTKIEVSECLKLTEIVGLGELKSLESLELDACVSIDKLPNLSSLENLILISAYGSVKLTEIGGLGELKSLESLMLSGCESIEKLPDLSSLKNLTKLDVSSCVKLTEIGGLGELKSLELLKLDGCKSIEKLPNLSSLENLIYLDIRECSKLLGNRPCVANTRKLITVVDGRRD